MNTCMKCGRETQEKFVYCEHCLAIMEQYPVKPGTPVNLPRRNPDQIVKKPPRRRQPTPEEQVVALKKAVRILLACLVLVSAALGYFAWTFFTTDPKAPAPTENPIGQNYTVDSTES